jgi:hypothetical protein
VNHLGSDRLRNCPKTLRTLLSATLADDATSAEIVFDEHTTGEQVGRLMAAASTVRG